MQFCAKKLKKFPKPLSKYSPKSPFRAFFLPFFQKKVGKLNFFMLIISKIAKKCKKSCARYCQIKKRWYFCNPKTNGTGREKKREILGSSLKEWNDVANGSKQTLRDSQAIKSGQTKKEKEIN